MAVVISQERYSAVAIALHWAIAALILFNMAVGYWMGGLSQPVRGVIFTLHFSSGVTVLALAVLRILWRWFRPPPQLLPMRREERALAHSVHALLYAAMFIMPLLGLAIISAHPPTPNPRVAAASHSAVPHGPPPSKLWFVLPMPHIEAITEIGATAAGAKAQKRLHGELVWFHGLGGLIVIGLLVLHLSGALKHEFIDRQPELMRMGLGRKRGG